MVTDQLWQLQNGKYNVQIQYEKGNEKHMRWQLQCDKYNVANAMKQINVKNAIWQMQHANAIWLW